MRNCCLEKFFVFSLLRTGESDYHGPEIIDIGEARINGLLLSLVKYPGLTEQIFLDVLSYGEKHGPAIFLLLSYKLTLKTVDF